MPLLTFKARLHAAPEDGAPIIYERAFQVSPVKESGDRVVRDAVRSFRLRWCGVHEPKRKGSLLRAS
jgi:hypothetical protein